MTPAATSSRSLLMLTWTETSYAGWPSPRQTLVVTEVLPDFSNAHLDLVSCRASTTSSGSWMV
jgi:hypothetical protein